MLAVRMSISISHCFMPVKLAEQRKSRDRHWIVDGGLLINFPIRYFDSPLGQIPVADVWVTTLGADRSAVALRMHPQPDFDGPRYGAYDEYDAQPQAA